MHKWTRRGIGLGVAAVLAAGLLPLWGQDAPASRPATGPADTQPVPRIRLNFHDAPLDAVLDQLSEAAGFIVVKEAGPLDGRVTVLSMQPVTPEQAVALLNTVLKANGFAAIEEGRTLRIVAREKAKKGNLPVHFGADPAEIPPGDEMMTQVIPVRNVEAVKLKTDLQTLVGTDADFTANAGANALVMTDTASNIKRIVEIIAALDKHETTISDMKIFRLKNASAASAVKMITTIFPPEPPTPPNQPPRAKHEGKIPGSAVDQALQGAKVTAAFDERTNSVIVAGPTETLKIIDNMLKEIDADEATASQVKSFHLKVTDATSVARIIAQMFRRRGDDETGASQRLPADSSLHAHISIAAEEQSNTVVVTAPPATMTLIENVINDLESNPGLSGNVRSYHLKYADATGTAKVLNNIFQEAQQHQTGAAAQREKVSATADLRTNTVVVNGGPESLRTVDKIIQDLDASPTAGSEVEYFHLKSADATVTSKLIMGFFKPADGQPARPEDKFAHAGVNAAADERTNTVIVTAPPEAMTIVQKMVQELESDPSIHFDIRSYPLQFADAPTTAKLITTLYTPDAQAAANPLSNHPLGQELAVHARVIASSDDRTNTLVVTAPQETLKVIDNLVKLLDASPSASKNMRVYQLQYADASAAVKLIQSVYPTQPPVSTSGGAPKTPLSAEEIHRNLAINAAADDRTNTLVVNAPPDVLQVIDGIVKQLDSNPSSEETFFIYRLKNAQAVNLEIVLNQMFGNYSQPGQGGQGQRLPNQNGLQAFQQLGLGGLGRGGFGQGGVGLGRNAAFGNGNRGAYGVGGGTGTFNRSFGSIPGLSNGLGLARTFNELTGEVLVIADPDTNSLLVTTASKYEKHVREIIAELDHPVPQVLIKVLLAEVTHDNNADFGVDYSILNTRDNRLGQSFTQTFGNPGSGLIVNLVENKINMTLHALAQQGKLDVLSRPYILASDNQEASILVGQEVPLVTGTNVSALGQTFNNITYQDVGIILDVTPHINPDGLVTLDVAPTISQLTAQTVAVGPDTTAPVIAQRSAQSRVAIKDGQTIVIGGLMEDRKTETINKIPILGDIPVLRLAFSRTEIMKTKTELLIFLTPHVAQQPETLKPMSADELKGTKLTPRAVEPGVFDEHLRGLERGNVPEAAPTTHPSVRFRTNGESPATNPTTLGPAPAQTRPAEDPVPLPLN